MAVNEPGTPPATPPAPTGEPSAHVPPQTAVPQYDPREVEYLRTWYSNTKELVEDIAPYEDRVRRIAKDQQAREAAFAAIDAAENYRRSLTPEETPLEKKVDRLVKYVDENIEANARFQGTQYVANLANTYPGLKGQNNDWGPVGELQREAESMGIRDPMAVARYIETVAKRTMPPVPKEPPASLRGDAGEPGVPGKPDDKPQDPQNIRQWLINSARRANAAGG